MAILLSVLFTLQSKVDGTLVVDDDDVRQGQADRLFQARDAGTEEVGAMPRGDQDRHSSARLVLEPLHMRTTASLPGPAPR